MFIVNLAASDFCMMFCMGIPACTNAWTANHWIFGELACRIYGCLGAIFGKTFCIKCVSKTYDMT